MAGIAICAAASGQTRNVTYYYTDPQGTVLATADSAGNIVSQVDHRSFGDEALGPKENGPGFIGHVEDAESDLVYMQQRYYDPAIGRFISSDPASINTSQPHNFSRYAYANNNPYLFVDLDGREASLYWSSSSTVVATIRYSTTGSPLPFSRQAMAQQTRAGFSGLVNVGGKIVNITTKVEYVANAAGQPGVTTLNVVPDTATVTKSGRSETNRVGGDQVTLGAGGVDAASVVTAEHELGHVAGAGDQYKGGIDVNGGTLPADVAGSANVMKTLLSNQANDQSLREIIQSSSNKNSCAAGVHASSGGC